MINYMTSKNCEFLHVPAKDTHPCRMRFCNPCFPLTTKTIIHSGVVSKKYFVFFRKMRRDFWWKSGQLLPWLLDSCYFL